MILPSGQNVDLNQPETCMLTTILSRLVPSLPPSLRCASLRTGRSFSLID